MHPPAVGQGQRPEKHGRSSIHQHLYPTGTETLCQCPRHLSPNLTRDERANENPEKPPAVSF